MARPSADEALPSRSEGRESARSDAEAESGTVGSKTAADVFSAEILKGLAETVKELQREVSMQNTKYIKMSNEAAATQAHYDSVQAFHEAQSETHRSQIIDPLLHSPSRCPARSFLSISL